jgi:hypothetical protein
MQGAAGIYAWKKRGRTLASLLYLAAALERRGERMREMGNRHQYQKKKKYINKEKAGIHLHQVI